MIGCPLYIEAREANIMRGMRRPRFRSYRRHRFHPRRPLMRSGWGLWGLGRLLYPALGVIAIFSMALLLGLIAR